MLNIQKLRVTTGPLAGSSGCVVARLGQRVVLILELNGDQVQVEMDGDWLTPLASNQLVLPSQPLRVGRHA